MLFSSFTFLTVFLPILATLYFIVKKITKKIFWQNLILCLFSLLFYAWGEPVYIILMLVSIILNYFLAIIIEKNTKNKKYLIIAVFLNLLLIGFFKYGNFLIENINALFNFSIKSLDIPLPIGISFFTFQIMSYVIDVYRKDVKAQKNIMYLATYIALFPQLIAGPIVRYQTIVDQLTDREIKLSKIIQGLKRFIIGLSKKVIIANNVAFVCDSIYESVTLKQNSVFLWIALIAYTVQIYFDFSGYSDMAIGLGKMFGFEFLENFNYPYMAKSVTDFWRRWHISLSSWFRDYLYIPLGGNRVSNKKFIRNVLVVWLLTGLWHGASWNFILWGLYYGVFLLLEKMIFNKILERIPTFLKHIYTIMIFLFGWLIFRIETLLELRKIFINMFSFNVKGFIELLLENSNLINGILFIFIGVFLSTNIIKKISERLDKYDSWFYISLIFSTLLLFLCISYLLGSTYNPFIYFRF